MALPESIAIYELPTGAAHTDMRYRLAASLPCGAGSGSCSGLLLLRNHLILCQVTFAPT